MNKKDLVFLISSIGTLILGLAISFFYILFSSKFKEDEVDAVGDSDIQQYI